MPEFWSALGNTLWYMITIFIFVAYLMALFSIIGDLFRDRELSGGMKAVWLACLIFFPFITALIYLIVRGNGMSERSNAQAKQAKDAADAYIRSVAGSSAADEIAKAKTMLDSGAITQEEYAALKARVLR